MLTCVTFAWAGTRPIYGPWHAQNMRTMLRKHLTVPHRFVCITDDMPAMKAAGVDAYPIWPAPQDRIASGGGLRCGVRLGLFAKEHGGQLGDRIFAIDLDAIVRANIDDIVTSDAPVKFLSFKERAQLQGGMLLVAPGAVSPCPWDAFLNDATMPARAAKWVGSDQAVLSELYYSRVVSGEFPHWDEDDGVIVNHQIRSRIPEQWRVFFRTGARKCWVQGMNERDIYFAETGATPLREPTAHGDIRSQSVARNQFRVTKTDLPHRRR